MNEHTGLLMLYVAASMVVGVINVIVTSARSGERYRNHGYSKAKWVLSSLICLASIVIMMPGSFIYSVAYLAGPSRKLSAGRESRPLQSARPQREKCHIYNCRNGRVFVDGVGSTCGWCHGTGNEDGMW